MDIFFREIRYAFRSIFKRRSFSAAIILIIALGTGANTAIFSVINSVLIEPLPYPNSSSLLRLWEVHNQSPENYRMTSVSNFRDWQDRATMLSGLAAWERPSSMTLTSKIPAEEIRASSVTFNYFDVLGITASGGRNFLPEEGTPGRNRVAILSFDLWKRLFRDEAFTPGRQLELDKTIYQIIGIMPADFINPAGEADVWIPILLQANAIDRGQNYLEVIARIKADFTLALAQAELNSIAASLEKEHPSTNRNIAIRAIPMEQHLRKPLASPLLLLGAAVVFVLMIACFNAANLLIVRGLERSHEITIRMALGAGKSRIVRQILTENLMLFLSGGIAGLLLAHWILRFVMMIESGALSEFHSIQLDMTDYMFALAVCTLCGVIFGSAPAIQLRMHAIGENLKDSGRGSTTGTNRGYIRSLLLIAQISLSLVLIIVSVLLMQSFMNLRNAPPGFDAANVYVLQQALDGDRYDEPHEKTMYYSRLIERLKEVPGVVDAGASTVIPMGPFGIDFEVPYYRANEAQPEKAAASRAYFRAISTGYFETLTISLKSGRYFTKDDRAGRENAVIVNESLAKEIWPNAEPVGKMLNVFWADWQSYKVVGVVSNTRSYGPGTSFVPELFVAEAQIPYSVMNVLVRFEKESAISMIGLRSAFLEIDPSQPVQSSQSMRSIAETSIRRERFAAALIGAFTVMAFILAIAGVYGLMSFNTMRRSREIAIRMALGATRFEIGKSVWRQALLLLAPGVLIGTFLAISVSMTIKSFLYGVSSIDPFSYLLGICVLTIAAISASMIPAHRAASLDPNAILKGE